MPPPTIAHSRRGGAVAALGIAVTLGGATLTGCSQDTRITALDREAGPADVLPVNAADFINGVGFDEDSVRFVGAVDDVDIYLGRGLAASPVCVLLWRVAADESESTGLGTACGTLPVTLGLADGAEVRVTSIGTAMPEGFTRLDDNVVVRTLP